MRAPQRKRSATRAPWLLLIIGCLLAGTASARDDLVLEHLLREGRDFRVRARAAEALGRTQSPVASTALAAALVDKHPTVRMAAASALGQLGAADALPALRVTARDPAPQVAKQAREAIARIELALRRAGKGPEVARPVRYGLLIGELRDRSAEPEEGMLRILANSLDKELRTVDGAALLEDESALKGKPVYRVDGQIVRTDHAQVEDKLTAHASVALLLMDKGNQTLRIVFRGAATTIEDLDRKGVDQQQKIAQQAIGRAVRAALRNASSAMKEALASKK
ncbi:MAG TPA: HEAT repeat domain-containing protein [Polyangiales bacterium]|nr:HEAT repeat domain-containing protein [Polyangiales bacterium]